MRAYIASSISSARRTSLPSMSATSAAFVFSTGSPNTADLVGPARSGYRPLPWSTVALTGRRADDADRDRGRWGGARTARGEQYFSRRPASRSDRRRIAVRLPDVRLDLVTDRGVFAGARLDPGTETLLRRGELVVPDGDPARPRLRVRADRAHAGPPRPGRRPCGPSTSTSGPATCAARTPRRPALANVTVAAPDDVPADVRFAAIWSNPPIRIGKAAAARAAPALAGPARRRRRPATSSSTSTSASDSLARWLVEQGWTTVRRASHDGYRLLDVTAAVTG